MCSTAARSTTRSRTLARRAFEHELTTAKEVLGTGKSLICFAEVATAAARDFAAERADAALRLHGLLKARLVREHMTTFYETIERPLVPVVAAMEDGGSRSTARRWPSCRAISPGGSPRSSSAIWRDVGNEFNIGSTKQLGDVLFEKLRLPGGKKGKTGAYGTDASILEKLAPLHPVPAQVLEWRQLTKLKSTYADASATRSTATPGGCTPLSRWPRPRPAGSRRPSPTSRTSRSAPRKGAKIRRAFVAEPGHLLLSADYSQIELRLAAHVAEVAELKDAFREGHDIHALTASEVFGVPLDRMDPKTRRRAKAINFGIIYGISAFGLGNQIGVPQGEAADYIRAYFERFPASAPIWSGSRPRPAAPAMSRRSSAANASSRASATPTRRAAPAPSGRRSTRRLQGSAADIIKRAMGRIPAPWPARG